MITLLVFSFLAGMITILSPCILSILPILLVTSGTQNRYKSLGIIIGLVTSFAFFTLSLNAVIKATNISPDVFRYTAIIIIIFFGLTLLIPALENVFTLLTLRLSQIGQRIQEHTIRTTNNFLSGFILGSALGLIWTPCAGPILATITVVAATSGVTFTVILMTIAYCAGAAVPMLIITYGGTIISNKLTFLAPYTAIIRKFFGVIIILSALAIFYHKDIVIEQYFLRYFPSLSIENNPLLQKELTRMKKQTFTFTSDTPIKAPELVGISDWINSKPLLLENLKGKILLLDFWTYSCINCIRTLPYLKQWYTKYKDSGFEIIGIHTPEFAFEKNVKHVQDAVNRFSIPYPVALDNDYKTWNAYNNHYWPAHYIINKEGFIVAHHFGEGNYVDTENIIRNLLNLEPVSQKHEATLLKITPETYLGCARAEKYHSDITLEQGHIKNYTYKKPLAPDNVGINGQWLAQSDCITAQNNSCSLDLNFIASHVYLVMESPTPQPITVLLDGKALDKKYYGADANEKGHIIIHEPRMYEIVNIEKNYGRHILTLQFSAHISAYVFTFG